MNRTSNASITARNLHASLERAASVAVPRRRKKRWTRVLVHGAEWTLLSKMAADGGGKETNEIKTQFSTREGVYKLLPNSEYSRPNRVPFNSQGSNPVKVSFVNVNDQSGNGERICFNVGRELYFYIYKGVRKVTTWQLLRLFYVKLTRARARACYSPSVTVNKGSCTLCKQCLQHWCMKTLHTIWRAVSDFRGILTRVLNDDDDVYLLLYVNCVNNVNVSLCWHLCLQLS